MTRWKLPKPWLIFVATCVVGLMAAGLAIGVPWFQTQVLIEEIQLDSESRVAHELAVPEIVESIGHTSCANLLKSLPQQITQVSVEGPRYGDSFLHRLSRQTSLKTLTVLDSSITADGWKFVPGKSLEVLVARNNSLSDAGLRNFPVCPKLRTLDLWNCRMAGPGLERLSAFPALTEISLSNNPLTNEYLHRLAACFDLHMVNLSLTPITGRGLAALRACRALETLDASSTLLNDEGLGEISQLITLRELDVGFTHATPVGYRQLAQLSNLQILSLARTPIDDSVLAALASCPQLRELNLDETKVSDTAVTQLLRDCRSLSRVTLKLTGRSLEEGMQLAPPDCLKTAVIAEN